MDDELLQAKLGYQFGRPSHLRLALTAAHRSDIDGTSDDGNRLLAKLGMCAVDMTETYRTIIVDKGTSKDANIQDHWFKNKRKRASVCHALGVDLCLTQSVRQKDRAPSTDVLATALSAVVGAIWLDLQTQNGSLPIIIEQTFAILCRMETAIAQMESTGVPLTLYSTDDEVNSSLSHNTVEIQNSSAIQSPTIAISDGTLNQVQLSDVSPIADSLEFVQTFDVFDFGADDVGNIWNCIGLPGMNEIAETLESIAPVGNKDPTVTKRGSVDIDHSSQPTTKMRRAHKKPRGELDDKHDETTLYQRLLLEELEKSKELSHNVRSDLRVLLDHPEISGLDPNCAQVPRLRLLYLTLGSGPGLLAFKNMLQTARSLSNNQLHTDGSSLRPAERYAEICRLGNQEALCVLLRRYHVVELFKTAQAKLVQEHGVIVETPTTYMAHQITLPGNPSNRAQANLTEAVLGTILPGLANGSPHYQKTRSHVTQLRRLANILTIWTDVYGLGVLALLPSSLNPSEFTLTDYMYTLSAPINSKRADKNRLLNMTEKRIKAFSEILRKHQGQYLKELSIAVEPALMALVDGTLPTSAPFPIEILDCQILESVSKGRVVGYLS